MIIILNGISINIHFSLTRFLTKSIGKIDSTTAQMKVWKPKKRDPKSLMLASYLLTVVCMGVDYNVMQLPLQLAFTCYCNILKAYYPPHVIACGVMLEFVMMLVSSFFNDPRYIACNFAM